MRFIKTSHTAAGRTFGGCPPAPLAQVGAVGVLLPAAAAGPCLVAAGARAAAFAPFAPASTAAAPAQPTHHTAYSLSAPYAHPEAFLSLLERVEAGLMIMPSTSRVSAQESTLSLSYTHTHLLGLLRLLVPLPLGRRLVRFLRLAALLQVRLVVVGSSRVVLVLQLRGERPAGPRGRRRLRARAQPPRVVRCCGGGGPGERTPRKRWEAVKVYPLRYLRSSVWTATLRHPRTRCELCCPPSALLGPETLRCGSLLHVGTALGGTWQLAWAWRPSVRAAPRRAR